MTLGQLFQSRRLESGRSLEQLAALTKIHIKILTAIEADDYTDLPARAFTRGFIVNYAKALKLDADAVLAEHQAFLEEKFSERQDRDKGHQGYVFEGKENEQTRRWMIIGASVAILFAGTTLFVFKPQNHKHKEQHKEFEEEVSSLQPATPTSSPLMMNGVIATASVSSSASPSLSSLVSTSASSSPSNSPAVGMSSNVASSGGSSASASPSATASATPKPTATSKPSATPTAAPKASSTPAGPLAITANATSSASPSPSATPEATPTPPKDDKLNKGDDLDPKAIKARVTFEAQEDVWVRYKIDNKPYNTIILRKGRYLAIKAASRLYFETPHAENLKFKTRGTYKALEVVKGEVAPDGSVKNYEGSDLGNGNFPEEIPSPRQ